MKSTLLVALGSGLLIFGTVLLIINIIWPAQRNPLRAATGVSAQFARWERRIGRRMGIEALVGTGVGLLLAALTQWLAFIVLIPVVVVVVPRLFSDRAEKANTQMLVDLEAWTRSLSGLITGGRNLTATLKVSLPNANGAMQMPVRRLVARLSGGWSTERALRGLGSDLDDATADLLVMNLISAARNPGKGLKEALDGLAALVADEVQTRRKVSAERAKPRLNARIVLYITVAGILCMPFIPMFADGYRTPLGQIVFMALLLVIGAILARMQWIVRTAPPPRVLEEVHP